MRMGKNSAPGQGLAISGNRRQRPGLAASVWRARRRRASIQFFQAIMQPSRMKAPGGSRRAGSRDSFPAATGSAAGWENHVDAAEQGAAAEQFAHAAEQASVHSMPTPMKTPSKVDCSGGFWRRKLRRGRARCSW